MIRHKRIERKAIFFMWINYIDDKLFIRNSVLLQTVLPQQRINTIIAHPVTAKWITPKHLSIEFKRPQRCTCTRVYNTAYFIYVMNVSEIVKCQIEVKIFCVD